ncbi:MAG: dephospho-CoA kinase [Rectinema sp.]|nr:dephospho-CoA kinase [Rectinema sp.]
MDIIGLTGGYCAGKNEVANILAEHGWEIIDVDRLGHQALQNVAEKIKEAFGSRILLNDGTVDRRALGAMVFNNPSLMAKLESIVHPEMLSILDTLLMEHQKKRTEKLCINAALLYRFPQRDRCSAIIEVRAPVLTRIFRARQRDGLSPSQAFRRILSQRSLWHLRPRPPIPVYYISNFGSLLMLSDQVDRILLALMRSRNRRSSNS